MSLIETIWYQKLNHKNGLAIILLYPLSLLFRVITFVRRYFYKHHLLKVTPLKVPSIVVGGISVGGSGKTPLSIALIEYLSNCGYKVGLVSRGYKGKAKSYPLVVNTDTKACESGDEPLLIKMALQDKVTVCVDPNKDRGCKFLEEKGVDVIVSDDGLQHYSLDFDIEIVVLDGKRLLGNGFLMPAGPLREGKWHLKTCDAVVVNGETKIDNAYNMQLVPGKVIPLTYFLKHQGDSKALDTTEGVVAMAGIGNPKRFYSTLENLGYTITNTIEVSDHQKLSDEQVLSFARENKVVMTAKDAVKYAHLQSDNLYVLNVQASLDNSFFEKIKQKLIDRINH
ncbi:MAG: tetraacyldisaccharide 4'-kinase [Succinivibrio sp.]|nr:tetraacyldisaccharide 4'-kinase [Succinivibrio sp.]